MKYCLLDWFVHFGQFICKLDPDLLPNFWSLSILVPQSIHGNICHIDCCSIFESARDHFISELNELCLWLSQSWSGTYQCYQIQSLTRLFWFQLTSPWLTNLRYFWLSYVRKSMDNSRLWYFYILKLNSGPTHCVTKTMETTRLKLTSIFSGLILLIRNSEFIQLVHWK